MNSAFLLDTSVLSETIRKYPDPKVINFLETAEEIWIPSGALLEIQMGIAKATANSPRKAVELSIWYLQILESGIDIVSTTQSVIDKWGTLLGDSRLLNLTVPSMGSAKPRGGQDLHIAAAALMRGMVVATYNVKDFLLINEYYPLAGVYNPKEDKWYAKMQPLEEYLAPTFGRPEADNNNLPRRELKFVRQA